MCVIISIYQKEKDSALIDPILKAIELEKEANSDGIGIVGLNFDNEKIYWKRELEIKKEEIKRVLLNFDIVNIHLRQATSGGVKKDFVHFWKVGNWFFAHNGVVREFSYKNIDMCDSLVFFKELLRKNLIKRNGKLKVKKIKNYSNNIGFYGRFVLINTATNKIYYFGDFQPSILNKKILILSTKELDLRKKFNLFGIEFEDKASIEEIKGKKIEGIMIFDIKKQRFRLIDNEFLTWDRFGGYLSPLKQSTFNYKFDYGDQFGEIY